MISYGGVALLLPTDGDDSTLAKFLADYQDLGDLKLFSPPPHIESQRSQSRADCGAKTNLPKPNWPAAVPPRINQLYWPTGASRWSYGLFLATTAAKEEIENKIAPGETSSNQALSLVMEDEDGERLATAMWLLPPRPISGFVPQPDDEVEAEGLWLLPLVDVRYFWQFKDAAATLALTNSSTWSSVFSALASQLGVSLTQDTVSGDYFKPDRVELTRKHENAALLLDACAASVGQRIVRWVDGSVRAQNVVSAKAALRGNVHPGSAIDYVLVAGGKIGQDKPPLAVPAAVKVVFPKYAGYVPMPSMGLHAEEISAEDLGYSSVTANAKLTIFTTAAHQDDAAYPGDNAGDVEALATQIATDYYAWQGYTQDRTFSSIKSWKPTGFDDHTLWSFGHQRQDGNVEAQTRVQSLPPNFAITEQLSQIIATEDCAPLYLLRLESNLCPGSSATARRMRCAPLDSACSGAPVTLPGPVVTICDDRIKKALARGTEAPSGDDGGDEAGTANLVWGTICGVADEDGTPTFAYVSGGSYYRYIEGTFAADQGTYPWRVLVSDITGYDGEFIYGITTDDDYEGGEVEYIDLATGPCGGNVAGVKFGAWLFGCTAYRSAWICCQD